MCISGRKTTCSSVCFPTVRNPPVQAMWRVGFPLHKPYILCKRLIQLNLVGGLNPVEKYARQIGSSPQVGMKIKKCLSCHHLVTSFPENYNSLKLTFKSPPFRIGRPFGPQKGRKKLSSKKQISGAIIC